MLHPVKGDIDHLAFAQTDDVTGMASGAPIQRSTTASRGILRYMSLTEG